MLKDVSFELQQLNAHALFITHTHTHMCVCIRGRADNFAST